MKIIPILLFAFTIFSAYGPQSAFDVSRWSQMNRLESMLEKNAVLVDDKIVEFDATIVEQSEVNEIGSVIWYLVEYHGLEVLQPWFETDLKELTKDYVYYDSVVDYPSVAFTIMAEIGFDNFDAYSAEGIYAGSNGELWVDFNAENVCESYVCADDIAGYKYEATFSIFPYSASNEGSVFLAGGKKYSVELAGDQNRILSLKDFDCASCKPIAEFDLKDFVIPLIGEFGDKTSYFIPKEKMYLNFPGGQIRLNNFVVLFKDELEKENEFRSVDSAYGSVLLKK